MKRWRDSLATANSIMFTAGVPWRWQLPKTWYSLLLTCQLSLLIQHTHTHTDTRAQATIPASPNKTPNWGIMRGLRTPVQPISDQGDITPGASLGRLEFHTCGDNKGYSGTQTHTYSAEQSGPELSSGNTISPRESTARRNIELIADTLSFSSTRTLQRLSRALFTWNDGFSVVAPISVIVPHSTWGRNVSWPEEDGREREKGPERLQRGKVSPESFGLG